MQNTNQKSPGGWILFVGLVLVALGLVGESRQQQGDVTEWRPSDGFSRVPFIVTWLEGAAPQDGLVGLLDPAERSLSVDTSATLLLEAWRPFSLKPTVMQAVSSSSSEKPEVRTKTGSGYACWNSDRLFSTAASP